MNTNETQRTGVASRINTPEISPPNRTKPVTPKDLIEAGVGAKNTIYAAIKSGEIETFRLGGKIIIAPEWVSKNLGWQT